MIIRHDRPPVSAKTQQWRMRPRWRRKIRVIAGRAYFEDKTSSNEELELIESWLSVTTMTASEKNHLQTVIEQFHRSLRCLSAQNRRVDAAQ